MSTPDWIIKEQNEAVARCYIRDTNPGQVGEVWSEESFKCAQIRQLTRIAASLQVIAETAPDAGRLAQLILMEKGYLP